jgi:predicted nucleic acid-binding protein
VFVLDTNVISELMRADPDEHVLAWIQSQPGKQLDTTAITVAEIRYGIERLRQGRRRQQIARAAEDVFAGFDWQILSFDRRAALDYAKLVAEHDRAGRPLNAFDAQIAAICRSSRAALVTRNVSDFKHTELELIDPWQSTTHG